MTFEKRLEAKLWRQAYCAALTGKRWDAAGGKPRGEAMRSARERLRPEHAFRFRRLITGLNRLLDDVRKVEPDANYYLDDDGMCLMFGLSHTPDDMMRAQHENVACRETLNHSGGGGF